MSNTSTRRRDIVIEAVGMVTSLGFDAATSCAAARAGLVRTSALSSYCVPSSYEAEPEGLAVHQVPLLTEGFEGYARLLRLTESALVDLRHNLSADLQRSRRTVFYVSMPDPRRRQTGLELLSDDKGRASWLSEARDQDTGIEATDIAPALVEDAAELSGWPFQSLVRFVTSVGHAGVAEALAAAVRDLDDGVCEMAVVGGIDTLLDEETLEWFEATGRLKTPDNPVGALPGEAAAFFAVRLRESTDTIPTLVSTVQLGEESQTLLAGGVPTGVGLADVLARASAVGNWQSAAPIWVITDQNGEPYRATEWANAQVRLIPRFSSWQTPELMLPAIAFGETGAASGAISVCVAVAAFERRYAPGGVAFVASSSDATRRACIVLSHGVDGTSGARYG